MSCNWYLWLIIVIGICGFSFDWYLCLIIVVNVSDFY